MVLTVLEQSSRDCLFRYLPNTYFVPGTVLGYSVNKTEIPCHLGTCSTGLPKGRGKGRGQMRGVGLTCKLLCIK